MYKPTKILLAEDEPSLGLIVKESLETRKFKVYLCDNGEKALTSYKEIKPDILVLDVMMPRKDGFTLAKEIRAIDTKTPIIFLSAKSQTEDVLQGFHSGGNDYLRKPFSLEELVVRIQNLLEIKIKNATREPVEVGEYKFYFSKQILQFKSEEQITLTYRESQLLNYLIIYKNKVLERSFILNKLWDQDDFFTARSMDVFISKLRKKLNKDKQIHIVNVRGFGYKLIC